MIRRIHAFCAFWYDFIIGDDWRVAVVVGAALAITSGLSSTTGVPVWWIVVVGVAIVLPLSIHRVTPRRN